jgi:hypothetical protein
MFLLWPLANGNASCNNSNKAPPCPTSGSTLLDDTYPVAAYTVSIAPFRKSPAGYRVTNDFIINVLQGHDFAPGGPKIFVPADQESFKELEKQLTESIQKSGGKIPAGILENVVRVDAPAYTWQQDYFESFVDLKTGRPVLREVQSYDSVEKSAFVELSSAMSSSDCGISEGKVLTSHHDKETRPKKGEMGGNIEALPGGLCLIGDNQAPEFANQFCGSEENQVVIDVGWLKTSHVDEIVKVIPTNRPGVPAECNFSLMFASPAKALELMGEPRIANHPFFAPENLAPNMSQEELEEFRASRSESLVGGRICLLLNRYIEPHRSSPSSVPAGGKAHQARIDWLGLFISSAHASASSCEVETITNREFLKAIKESPYYLYNQKVQESMDQTKAKVVEKILERLPHCRPHLNVLDVPNLFHGKMVINEDGSKELPKAGGDGAAFNPNPTNSVVANKSLIFSDPQNPVFRDYLSTQMRQLGLKASYIDTWDYAHLGGGNLHCSSHSIPYCAPVAGRGR